MIRAESSTSSSSYVIVSGRLPWRLREPGESLLEAEEYIVTNGVKFPIPTKDAEAGPKRV
jgi:hypothetical protein